MQTSLFGFEINYNLTFKDNWLAQIFLLYGIANLVLGLSQSHFLAHYRLADSMIPTEAQLVESGPYTASLRYTRNRRFIDFQSTTSHHKFALNALDFYYEDAVVNAVKTLNLRPAVFLSLYTDNPIRPVWKVRIGSVEVLSFEQSLKGYYRDIWNIEADFYSFAASFVCLVFSFFSINRKKGV
jgi:hypothetical protein